MSRNFSRYSKSILIVKYITNREVLPLIYFTAEYAYLTVIHYQHGVVEIIKSF